MSAASQAIFDRIKENLAIVQLQEYSKRLTSDASRIGRADGLIWVARMEARKALREWQEIRSRERG